MTTVKKALLQILIGKSLNVLDVNELQLLSACAIQKRLLQSLDGNSDHDTTTDESSFVDVGCQTTSDTIDQYSSFCCKETLPLSTGNVFSRPPTAIDEGEKPALLDQAPPSTAKHSTDEMEYCSAVRRRNPDHGNIRVNSNPAVDGALHFLKLATALKTPGASYYGAPYNLLSQSNAPLRTLSNMFDVAGGIEELIRNVVVLKRAQDDHDGDYHNNIVSLLSTVCAVNKQIRDCVIDKLEQLLKSASSDEEDVWCLGLLIEDLCVNNSETCIMIVKMLIKLLLSSAEESVKQTDYSILHSAYGFCLLQTMSTILRFSNSQLENSSDEKYIHVAVNQLAKMKTDLVKIVNELRNNQNFLLVSYNIQQIIDRTQTSIDYVQEMQLNNMICE